MFRIMGPPVDRIEAWEFDVRACVKYLSRYDYFMNLMLSHNIISLLFKYYTISNIYTRRITSNIHIRREDKTRCIIYLKLEYF